MSHFVKYDGLRILINTLNISFRLYKLVETVSSSLREFYRAPFQQGVPPPVYCGSVVLVKVPTSFPLERRSKKPSIRHEVEDESRGGVDLWRLNIEVKYTLKSKGGTEPC